MATPKQEDPRPKFSSNGKNGHPETDGFAVRLAMSCLYQAKDDVDHQDNGHCGHRSPQCCS